MTIARAADASSQVEQQALAAERRSVTGMVWRRARTLGP